MPARPALIVEDSTGDTRFTLTAESAERVFDLTEMAHATAVVDRAAWLELRDQIDEVNDRARIRRGNGTTFFEGRIQNDERDGNTINVRINSYEQDAVDAQPTDSLEVFQNVDDSAVVTDALGDIPTLSAGTVDTVATGVSFTFAHAARSKQIRDAAEPGGADVRYNSDRTVDFLTRRGSDKSDIAISSTDQDIVEELEVEQNTQDPVTHIRGLGAQSGDEQVSYEAVISDYSAGDRQVWREYTNTDIVNQDRLETVVDRLIQDYNDSRRRITVTAGLVGLDVVLGDSLTVTLDSHDIDEVLRIVRLRDILGTQERQVATLTNRNVERGGEQRDRDDIERFRSGYEGFVDRDVDSYGWQPVDGATNAVRPYPYPQDVVAEQTAEVLINSRAYRAYSQGAADNTNFSNVASADNSSGNFTINDTFTTGFTFTMPTGTKFSSVYFNVSAFSQEASDPTNLVARLYDNTTGEYYPQQSGTENARLAPTDYNAPTSSFGINIFEDISGHDIDVEFKRFGTSDYTITAGAYYQAAGRHTHDPDPGIIEFANEEASNVDLIVNGNTVASDINSGTFTETVDISGELTAGDNTIEVASDTLGLVNMTVRTQLFRQGEP